MCVSAHADEKRPPNVLLILADDLGFSDLACYGGEIATPNLDALADNGLRFTQFHNTARCWPTRAALLTGYYAQTVRRDSLPQIPSGNRGVRPEWAPLLPKRLAPLGYRSYHSGKWHIDGKPIENGFDHSYLLQDQGRFFNPKVHFKDDVKLPAVESGSDYYGTVAIADHAIECLREHAKEHADKPFFHYLAFTAPHFPLQALPEDIAKYRERYRAGWNVVRAERWKRIQEKGIVSGKLSEVEREVGPPYHFPAAFEKLGSGEINRPLPWDELTDEQREFQAEKMAIHAAMVDRMDHEIGRVLKQLKDMSAYDNTLILFLSDNGASAEIMVRDDGHDPNASPGSAATYLCLGPGWSTVCNTPFRRHKTWVHQGGIATPLIAHWPAGIEACGELRRRPGHVIDIVPTILELARGHAAESSFDIEFAGRSFASQLQSDDAENSTRVLWWAHEGNRAVRDGDLKLVAAAGDPWSLFDLSVDPTESRDIAAQHPDRVNALAEAWEQEWAVAQRLATPDESPEQLAEPIKTLILPGESFEVAGHPAFILQPPHEKRQLNQPWILYAPTLPAYPDAHEKWMHEQFVNAGIAVAGIDVGEAYGSPEGQKSFDALYQELTTKRGFSKKPCLLGRSRGGLWVTSWAVRNPDKVAGIAGIYPVFDLRTYPGLDRAAPAYKLTAEELGRQLAKHNPISQVDALAKAKIPVYIIHGDDDKVVPLVPNSQAFFKRYEAAGVAGQFTLNVVPGQGHNYWEGFFRCEPLVRFAIERAQAGAAESSR